MNNEYALWTVTVLALIGLAVIVVEMGIAHQMRLNIYMDIKIKHALQARIQGFSYTRLELVNWLCTEFDITVKQAELYVAEMGIAQ